MMLGQITKSRKLFDKILPLKLYTLNSGQIDCPVRGVATYVNNSCTQGSFMAFCQVDLFSESFNREKPGNVILTYNNYNNT